MQVHLAGHNLDREVLREIRALLLAAASLPEGLSADADAVRAEAARIVSKDNWTPETLSAAYARISRDPRPVTELRAVARDEVDAARRSNETIIFGLGHASVAEHAVVNLDILGVSRLAVEEIERMRLCSYTEKSQRYILLDEDFVVPEEIAAVGLAGDFRALLALQNQFYRSAYDRILPWVFATHPEEAASKKNHRMLEGLAKEDARYGLSLATTVQLGETLNARNLEALISRTAAHPLEEVRRLSRCVFDAVIGLAPSVVRYTTPTEYRTQTPAALRAAMGDPPAAASSPQDDAILIDLPGDAEERVVAAILHSCGHGDATQCRERAAAMGEAGRREILRAALRHLGPHDPVLREFEHVAATFELVVSAACFGQLKRHRMATLTTQEYDSRLGVTVPPSFAAVGLVSEFERLRAETERLHGIILERTTPAVAAYALMNAHRRRVLWTLNMREIYHVARLRMDGHAQWDIRAICTQVVEKARSRVPALLALACGKDAFDAARAEMFGPPSTAPAGPPAPRSSPPAP